MRASSFRPSSLHLTATAVISVTLIAFGQHPLRGQVAASRLSTVLADLVAAAPPRTQVLPAAPSGQARALFDTLPVSAQDAMRGRRLRMDAASNVQVTVLLSAVTDDTIRDLTTAGAVIEIADAAGRRVQAGVPASRLSAVAAVPSVTFVQLPHYAVRRIGSVTSEGDSIMAADVARQQFGVDGTGVRVGVLSDGLKGLFATGCTTCAGAANGPIALGDLPNSTGTRTSTGILNTSTGGVNGQSFQANHDLEGLPPASPPCGFPGAGAEGTALLEIVHDIAPGAQLAFANADTDLAFNQAVNSLASSNDVVVDDLGFFGFAYDGTSPVSANTASALNNPANRIRAYVTSVGNDTDGHYLGSYVNSGTDISSISGVANPGHAHLFQSSGDTTDVLGLGGQSYDPIVLPTNGEVVIFLTWDDAFGRSGNNYDLYLVQQSTGRVVARSVDTQTGSQDPLEAIDFTNRGGSDTFRIVVQNVRDAAAPRQLNLFLFEPECALTGPQLLASGRHEKHNYNTVTRSVAAQSDAGGSPVSVISVGAVCSASGTAAGAFPASESCNDRTHQTIEFYSSRGPTLDGRMKPDISAIDGVSVTGAGSFENPFFGTSAAAPHIAGEAALVLQGASCLISGAAGAADPVSARANLRNMILSGATPIGDAGPDNTFGVGLGNVFASVQKTLPAFSGPPTIVVSGNAPGGASLTPAALGFSDPNQCALTRVSWTGGCGSSPAAALTCPFGTSSVRVAASNNGVSFSDATPLQITVTSFVVGASPASATVAAGQAATYRVTLSAQGGAFTNAVNLSCANLPVGTSCAFAPASAAPGAGAVDTTLTITTTARTGFAEVRSSKFEVRSWAGGLMILAVVLAAAAPLRQRWAALAPATGVVALALALASCGGSNNAPPIVSPTPTPTPPAGSPGAAVSPASLTFGNQSVQTTSAPQTLTLTNSGSAALAITSITASGDFAQTNSCGGSVAAGGSCTITVTFTPTSASARTGSVTITDNAPSSPQTVTLSGAGVPAAGGTPAGTYQIVITGTSGSLVQTQSVALIVQ